MKLLGCTLPTSCSNTAGSETHYYVNKTVTFKLFVGACGGEGNLFSSNSIATQSAGDLGGDGESQ